MGMNKLRVILVDDHAVIREGLVSLIDAQSDMQVIAQAGDGREGIEQARLLRPDVVVMDVSMPEMNGIEATRIIKRELAETRILALTAYDNPVYMRQLAEAGATGYVLKRSAAQEVIGAIRAVASGANYFDRAMMNESNAVGSFNAKRLRGEIKSGEITDREQEVLLLTAHGYTNKEIAERLYISVKTVETHKSNVMAKLNLKNRADAVRYALHQGWLRDS